MGFKENLLKKIEINRLTARIIRSIGPPGRGQKVDKEAMRRLLEIGGYTHRRVREMDFYLKDADGDKGIILVLDNDLTIYDTTVEDAAMRKNPFIKEMVSIRKIIKILNDKDVVVSRREESVKTVQQACLATVDLSFTADDIADIGRQGFASLESNYAEGVLESLAMFAELLGYQPPPKAFKLRHYEIYSSVSEKASGETMYGPLIIYSRIDNTIKLVEEPIGIYDTRRVEFFQRVAAGDEKAPMEGEAVFRFLREAVLRQ